MWRPEGCEVDYRLNKMDKPNDGIDNDNFRRGWHRGQEKLLETLRKEGAHTGKAGTWTFIPDD